METKLEYMKRVLKEMEDSYRDLAKKGEAVLFALSLGTDDGDPGPFDVIAALRREVRIGEEYTRPFEPIAQKFKVAASWCEEHGTNYFGDHCNIGEHRRKL